MRKAKSSDQERITFSNCSHSYQIPWRRKCQRSKWWWLGSTTVITAPTPYNGHWITCSHPIPSSKLFLFMPSLLLALLSASSALVYIIIIIIVHVDFLVIIVHFKRIVNFVDIYCDFVCNNQLYVSAGAAEVLPIVEADLKKTASKVIEQAKELCTKASVIILFYHFNFYFGCFVMCICLCVGVSVCMLSIKLLLKNLWGKLYPLANYSTHKFILKVFTSWQSWLYLMFDMGPTPWYQQDV